MKKWTAYYMPATDGKDPSKEFDTKKEAEDYVKSRNCSMCKKDGLGSMCACEWEILKTKDLAKCKTFEDIMLASGWKYIKDKDIKK